METLYFLQSFGVTGRLPFNQAEQMEQYVAKVIAAEQDLPSDPTGLAFIGTDRDDTSTENFDGLVEPLHDRFVDQSLPVSLTGWGRATKAELIPKLSATAANRLAFISAHGYEFLDGNGNGGIQKLQQHYQGALILDDFGEDRIEFFDAGTAPAGLLTAADVEDIPIL